MKLTERQALILKLIARGETTKSIAASLGVCEQTVDYHLERLMRRFKAHSRTHLVCLWMRSVIDDILFG